MAPSVCSVTIISPAYSGTAWPTAELPLPPLPPTHSHTHTQTHTLFPQTPISLNYNKNTSLPPFPHSLPSSISSDHSDSFLQSPGPRLRVQITGQHLKAVLLPTGREVASWLWVCQLKALLLDHNTPVLTRRASSMFAQWIVDRRRPTS